jgi:isopentenyl diphosphate isomerase/L-lactate dehydrogenase-like FMN-dependent dehydrogenase
VRHVLKSLLAEFDILMEVGGFVKVQDIDRSCIDSLPNSSNLIAEHSQI